MENPHKYNIINNKNDKRVILCQIIQYFWMLTPLPLKILPTPLPPIDNAEMTTPRKLQPSALHGSKAAKTLLL